MPNQRHFQSTVRKCELLNVYAVYFSVCFCFSEDTAFYNISTSSSPCLAALIAGFIKTSLFLGRYFNMHCRKKPDERTFVLNSICTVRVLYASYYRPV